MPMTAKSSFYGTSLHLPVQVAKDLNYVAKRLGVTQSALVAHLLGEPLADIRGLLQQTPEPADAVAVKRLRGQSAELVAQRLAEANLLLDDSGEVK